MRPVPTSAILSHSLSENLKEKGTFKSHFPNATQETNFAEAVYVVTFFNFVQPTFELDALLLVSFLDGRRKSWRNRRCSHCVEVKLASCFSRIIFSQNKNSPILEDNDTCVPTAL